MGRLGFALRDLSCRQQALALEERLSMEPNTNLSVLPPVFFIGEERAAISPPRVDSSPTVRTVWLLPTSVFTASRSPLPLGIPPGSLVVATSFWMLLQRCGTWISMDQGRDFARRVPLNRYRSNGQNASFRASWITRGLTAVLLMTPNVGEVKFVSGLANCG
jgi:hypothetical protein